MMTFHPTLVLAALPDEPPASYLSTMAMRIGRSQQGLAKEIGTTVKNISDGVPDAIVRLREACDLPEDTFAGSTFVKAGLDCRVGFEVFPPHALRRSAHFVCPLCLNEDIAMGNVPRAQLLPNFTVAHACPFHRVLYVRASFNTNPRQHFDFAWHIQQSIGTGLLERQPNYVETPSANAEYLAARIRGETSDNWLDTMPVFAVARFAEVIGLEMLFREVREWRTVTAAEWHKAGQLGFETLWQGRDAVKRAFSIIRENRKEDFRAHTWQEVYGNLHEFLARGNRKNVGLGEFQRIAHEHVVETMPIEAGTKVFSIKVAERKIHSIGSASSAYGINPATMRTRLMRLGAISNQLPGQGDQSTVFDAVALAEQLKLMQSSMSRTDALEYLNLIRPVGEAILAPEFIPHVHVPGAKGHRSKGYLKVDLDEFVGKLVAGAVKPQQNKGLVPVREAVISARTPLIDIVRMILGGKLDRVGHNKSETGFAGILVDPDEVMAITHALPPGRLSIPVAAATFSYSYPLFLSLISAGVIPSEDGRNSVTGLPRRTVAVEDLKAFSAKYISMSSLSAKLKMDPRLVKSAALKAGVKPAFQKPLVKGMFYLRRDTQRLRR
ncbi:MAG: hypothetical protein ABS75_25905 [Pelagibacterium sp. SCN 63-23]|nr:MAG: hypothetical protein ABS75_25905 [Pelagibacterium sp. SCN 63-23]